VKSWVLHTTCIEFRASIVLGAQSTSFEMLKALSHRMPVRPVATWLDNPCQPIAFSDLITYLVQAQSVEIKGHTVVEIGSPEVVAYGDLLDLVARLENLHRPRFQVPPIDQRLLLPMLDVVLPEFSEVAKKLLPLSGASDRSDRSQSPGTFSRDPTDGARAGDEGCPRELNHSLSCPLGRRFLERGG